MFPKVTDGWLGITDKYWATALLPETNATLDSARFTTGDKRYQADYMLGAQTIPIGGTGVANARLFAGAKEASVVGLNFPLVGFGGYNKQLGLNHFDLLIDWGRFYFITKPMFLALDWFYRLVGNFGIAILLVTVIVKLAVLPARQQVLRLDGEDEVGAAAAAGAEGALSRRPREAAAGDDGDLQEGEDQPDRRLSSRRLADPGVLLALQGAVHHHRDAARAVLRLDQGPLGAGSDQPVHAVRPDPFDPIALLGPHFGSILVMGIWPIIMGITMWVQMKLNPAPPDPTQKMIFDWMPLIFTFMLAGFPAGLVIYWAWNNTLSVLQQSFIMRKNGVKVELFDNLKSTFAKKPT